MGKLRALFTQSISKETLRLRWVRRYHYHQMGTKFPGDLNNQL